MIKVTVNNTKWSIPERLTVKEWLGLQKWEFDNPKHWPYIIESIINIDANELKGAEEESLQLFIGFIIGSINKRTHIDYKPFSNLNFGQFVDLDCYLATGVEKELKQILEVLEITSPWADEALHVVEQYIKWRQVIFKQYTSLFGLDGEAEEGEPKDFDPKQVSRGWYEVIVDLAGHDILRMDQITEEPLHKVLTFLQIKKEKAAKEAMEARKLNRKR